MKMPRKNSTTAPAHNFSQTSIVRCAFETSDGRRCRMPRHNPHPSLCLFHAREEMQLLESERLGSELSASLTGDFLTATDINFVLGKLFSALAQNRISHRNAATLAYVAQLMLQSLPASKREYSFHFKFEQWQNMLKKAKTISPSAPLATSPASTSNNFSDVTLVTSPQS